MFAHDAVPRGAPDALTYAVPEEYVGLVQPGVRVRVPLRRRMVTGLVVGTAESTPLDPRIIRPLAEVLDAEPLLPAHLLELASFVANYYRCPLGDTLAAMLPAALLRADCGNVPVAHDDLAVVTTKDENAHLPPGAQPRIFGPGSYIRRFLSTATFHATMILAAGLCG